MAFAKDVPTSKEPINPGPRVKAMALRVDFDIFAVRHFILRLHAMLLLVPISSGQRDKKWIERKEKTEVLLSLCGNLAMVQN